MTDVLLIGLVILFFVAADQFVRGCGHLIERDVRDATEDRP
jgi:hypothetical protein